MAEETFPPLTPISVFLIASAKPPTRIITIWPIELLIFFPEIVSWWFC